MITIYKTQHCPYCVMVTKLCERKSVPYEIVELDNDPSLRQRLMDITGMMTVPITTDGETYVVGWKPRDLMALIK